MWVPEHESIEDIEVADCLAEERSELRFVGPNPFFGRVRVPLKNLSLHGRIKINPVHGIMPYRCGMPKSSLSFQAFKLRRSWALYKQDLLTDHCPHRYHLKVLVENDCTASFVNTEKRWTLIFRGF